MCTETALITVCVFACQCDRVENWFPRRKRVGEGLAYLKRSNSVQASLESVATSPFSARTPSEFRLIPPVELKVSRLWVADGSGYNIINHRVMC